MLRLTVTALLLVTGCNRNVTVIRQPAEQPSMVGTQYCFSAEVEHNNGKTSTMTGCTPNRTLCKVAVRKAKQFGGYADIVSLTECQAVTIATPTVRWGSPSSGSGRALASPRPK